MTFISLPSCSYISDVISSQLSCQTRVAGSPSATLREEMKNLRHLPQAYKLNQFSGRRKVGKDSKTSCCASSDTGARVVLLEPKAVVAGASTGCSSTLNNECYYNHQMLSS